MKTQIFEVIKGISYRDDFDENSNLFDLGILDSFGTVRLIAEIEGLFDISLSLTELEREDIQSVAAIKATVEKKLGK